MNGVFSYSVVAGGVFVVGGGGFLCVWFFVVVVYLFCDVYLQWCFVVVATFNVYVILGY